MLAAIISFHATANIVKTYCALFSETAVDIVSRCRAIWKEGLYTLCLSCLAAIHSQFLHFAITTVAREYRKTVRQTVKKTHAHRKEVMLSHSKASIAEQDEVAVEPYETSICSGCKQESQEDIDKWIQCDRLVAMKLCFKTDNVRLA